MMTIPFMFLSSIFGFIFGMKSRKNILKWLLVFLNFIAFGILFIPFILAMFAFPGQS
jgi:hypothetical protein